MTAYLAVYLAPAFPVPRTEYHDVSNTQKLTQCLVEINSRARTLCDHPLLFTGVHCALVRPMELIRSIQDARVEEN